MKAAAAARAATIVEPANTANEMKLELECQRLNERPTKPVWISHVTHDAVLRRTILAVLYVHAQHTIILCTYSELSLKKLQLHCEEETQT